MNFADKDAEFVFDICKEDRDCAEGRKPNVFGSNNQELESKNLHIAEEKCDAILFMHRRTHVILVVKINGTMIKLRGVVKYQAR